MSILTIDTDHRTYISIIKVKGRVDSDTAPRFESALLKPIIDNRSKIVLDLQGVEFLSSAGLRAMVKALKETQRCGGDMHLASVSESVEVILRTVGFMQMFKIFLTSEEAAEGF